MDISTLSVQPSTFVHLKHPATGAPLFSDDKQPKPIGLDVYGPGSKEYRAAQAAVTNENLARRRKGASAESIEHSRVEILARCTIGFKNFDYKGQACSLEVCRQLYADPSLGWIREQVEEVAGDFGNFLGQPSNS